MKYFTYIFIITLLVLGGQKLISASAETTLLISEVQLGSLDSAKQEFIELANYSSRSFALDGVHIEYRSKDGTNWVSKATLSGSIVPYGRFLVSNYLDSYSQSFSGGLSGSGGHLRLVSNEQVLDEISWGDPDDMENIHASPATGQSLKRLVNEDGYFIDTDNHLTDWFVSDTPTPWFDEPATAVTAPQPDEALQTPVDNLPTDTPTGDTPSEVAIGDNPLTPKPSSQTSRSYAQLQLSEIMPDPVAPLTDAEHEYVELHNPNSFRVDITLSS